MKATRRRTFPAPDTLVAIVPTPQDFQIAELERWYRIPCRSAPKTLATTKWLAFYHTAKSGHLKWAVHFFAPVEGIERAPRRQLIPDEPDHPRATDPYYRLQIGELQALARPVPGARRRRLVFIPTTLAKLQAAGEINDLYHESPLEDQLWGALRQAQIPAERQFYVGEGKTSYCLDFAIPCARGSVDVECDGDTWHLGPESATEDNNRNNFLTRLGWHVLRFRGSELDAPNVSSSVEKVRDTAERLGGVELPSQVNRRFDRAGGVVEQLRLW